MAQKRMFDKALIDTDRFMDLPLSSKALYFLLGMEADDEGFVSHKKVMRIHGGSEDDLKILLAKNFVILFPSGVIVITDWNSNNYLDKNRLKATQYQNERKMLALTENNKYELNTCLTSIEERRGEENDFSKEKSPLKEIVLTEDGEQKSTKERTPKDKNSYRIAHLCSELIKKKTGVAPIIGIKQVSAVKNALQHVSEKDIFTMIEDACANGTAEAKGLSLNAILSHVEINKFKLANA